MLISKSKIFSSFSALNYTQFFAAFNDNLYKLLLIFFVISIKGEEYSNTILALAGAVFVIPFIVFASTAGTLADRYSKRTIIYLTRLIEILSTSLGILAFLFHSVVGGYIVLFLMATHSALFSPCKYGIIPELVTKQKVPSCNGIITATTYLAIILGTFFASFITEISGHNFVLAVSFCAAIAVIGTLCSLGVQKTDARSSQKKLSARFISTIYQSLKKARKNHYLLPSLIFGAYFLFMGAYTQLNIIPFTIQSLGLSEVYGGYLFLMTAIGIGIGSFLAGKLSGDQVELGFVPLAAIGVCLCFIGLFVFATHFFLVVPLLVGIGIFGGFYVVPIDTFIQIASPEEDRGQNVAASNFLSFIGVIIASAFIALFGTIFKLTAATGFLIVGLLTLIMSLILLILLADQVFRLIIATASKIFCHIRISGRRRIKSLEPTLLIAPCTSWLDTFIIMATLPRMIHYIIPCNKGTKTYPLLYRLLWLIPLDSTYLSPIGEQAFKSIKNELKAGRSICLMQPVDIPTGSLKDWEQQLEHILEDLKIPIMPIYISHKKSKKTGKFQQLKSLRQGTIRIFYGTIKQ